MYLREIGMLDDDYGYPLVRLEFMVYHQLFGQYHPERITPFTRDDFDGHRHLCIKHHGNNLLSQHYAEHYVNISYTIV